MSSPPGTRWVLGFVAPAEALRPAGGGRRMYRIDGRIREFWEQNGGLPVFGLPVTPQQQDTIEGKTLQVQ